MKTAEKPDTLKLIDELFNRLEIVEIALETQGKINQGLIDQVKLLKGEPKNALILPPRLVS